MLVRISAMLATMALVAGCHGSGPAADPNTGTMGTPGMYFRATTPLAPSARKVGHKCAPTSPDVANCAKD